MENSIYGYDGIILDIDLSTGTIERKTIPKDDIKKFIGGRGLGMKILWDRLKTPGIDPLSPENPLMFMPGPFCGFPIPSSSRICVVTKSPRTSPKKSNYKNASTLSYSNMGGFFGPEIRFAGYDGIVISGKASSPVYIVIEDEKVEIRDAKKFWGMGTDEFDKKIIEELGDRQFESCYIGPAGENLIPMACIINTAARSAGRGGTGCVMGSKNLKAIAIKGTKMPDIKNHKKYLFLLEEIRKSFAEDTEERRTWREGGTANALEYASNSGYQAVKNYREGTYEEIKKIGAIASRKEIWTRDFACYSCQLACKKSGYAKGAYGGIVHDAPEYETGTMLGANLLISDLAGLNKCITICDDYGIDIISTGNTIGFLIEAYEKKIIDLKFLDGIELAWGNVDTTIQMIHKICKKEGIGKLATNGVKALSELIGKGSEEFAIHVKGHELAAWNVQATYPWFGISYVTCNRGACHMNGGSTDAQNGLALRDSIGACNFASDWYRDELHYRHFLSAITGVNWTEEEFNRAGERIYNLEKMFNVREGFNKSDDILPERFYKDAFTVGSAKGAIVDRGTFNNILETYYESRAWNKNTSVPTKEKLESLELEFTINAIPEV
ncbi:MAG: aldehyde ferredoxin oxidoreductase family protein [Bacteroidales bacterium]|nr:aldehyde ferredoxin oxidoreductase family protein [Bacteroidales bacterium]